LNFVDNVKSDSAILKILVEKYERVKRHLKDIILNNFLGGIAWGLGATVGVSIIIAILSLILRNINLVPFVGDFVSQVTNYILQNNPQLIK